MLNERGAAMPGVLIFTFLFVALFLHQANIFLLEKQFYAETEQFFQLENMMDNALSEFKRDMQERKAASIYNYGDGTAHVSYQAVQPNVFSVSIECITTKKRIYEASFLYHQDTGAITNWTEER